MDSIFDEYKKKQGGGQPSPTLPTASPLQPSTPQSPPVRQSQPAPGQSIFTRSPDVQQPSTPQPPPVRQPQPPQGQSIFANTPVVQQQPPPITPQSQQAQSTNSSGTQGSVTATAFVPQGTMHPALAMLLTLATVNIFWLFWLYRSVKLVRSIAPRATNLTPGKAVGFLLIPIFGIYWFVRVAYDLPRAISRTAGTRPEGRVARAIATSMCLIGPILWVLTARLRGNSILPGIIGCEVLFLGFIGYCQSTLNQALLVSAGRVPGRQRSAGILYGAGIVWAICAALAIYISVRPVPVQGIAGSDAAVLGNAEQAMNNGDYAGAATLLKSSDTPEAKFELACLYKNGLGVEQDTQEAVSLLTDSANAGLPLAETMLGVWYANGDGVAADPAAAVVWYHKAAAQGDSNASELIGLAYGSGDGVEQDNAKAYMWFTVAGKQGNSDADSQKDLIGNMLEPAQKEAAENDAQAELERESGGTHE